MPFRESVFSVKGLHVAVGVIEIFAYTFWNRVALFAAAVQEDAHGCVVLLVKAVERSPCFEGNGVADVECFDFARVAHADDVSAASDGDVCD